MMSFKKKSFLVLLLIAAMAFLVVGCGGDEEPAGNGDEAPEPSEQEVVELEEITIGYVPWDCATASTHVLATVLEDEGFTVNLMDPSAALLFEGLTTGDIDVITTAWLPFTHANYMDEVEGQLMDLGSNYSGEARIGLVVPSYMDVDSIEDLDGDVANGRITGIDPGAGIMSATENAIESYELDYDLIDSSDAAMAAALDDAIANDEEIIVTGWAPHWKFGRYDLKFLEDPNGSFGEIETIHTLARLGLDTDAPTAFSIIDNFNWSDVDIATVMDMNTEGMDPKESARQWVDENQDKVAEWVN